MNLSFSLFISTLLATTTTTTVVLGQPIESVCPIPNNYATLGEGCGGKTEGVKCYTDNTNSNAVLCENGTFVATTPTVGEESVGPYVPPSSPKPCKGTGSTADGGCVISDPIVMGSSTAAKDASETDVTGIDVGAASVSAMEDDSGSSSSTYAAGSVVTFGIIAAFGSVVSLL